MKPLRELLATLIYVPASLLRHPAMVLVLILSVLWWAMPWLRWLSSGPAWRAEAKLNLITVFVEDPQRTIAAVDLWKQHPGSTLILQGRPSSQLASRAYLETQGKWPKNEKGIVYLTTGCDTVGQLSSLSRWLDTIPQKGNLTLVTSPAHLDRSLAIAQIMIGSKGWQVGGHAAATGDNRPESSVRLYRDELRAQIFRATGWEGGKQAQCP